MKKLLAIAALILAGCSVTSKPSKEQLAKADYGERPDSTKATATIRSDLERRLIDPESARLRCADAQKGWLKTVTTDEPEFGWVVYCEVNAKNQFGGYTGYKPQIYLFRRNRLVLKNWFGDAKRGQEFDLVN